MELFDSHSHYNDEKFKDDLDEIIKSTYDSGVTTLMCIGYNVESSKKAIEISNKYDFIYVACGISPNDIEQASLDDLKEIEEMARNNSKVLAIGEIGLDYYWEKDEEKRKIQKEFFKKQIELANDLDLPIVIHTRDAYIDTINILKEFPCKNTGIFHCCPLNNELIKDGVKLGYYISFSGVITFKNSKPEQAVLNVPIDKILIETDSPYLAPEPYRGSRNDSTKVIEVARKLSEIHKISLEEMCEITCNNARKVYKLTKDI
ncbi:MAG: TatD family hydrolase [Clostridia bacterium]|nr:TatD family hydrolase [Clostridia bacterium]